MSGLIPVILEQIMFLELPPEEKLKYLLRQEWGLQLLNKKIQELLAAYQKN